MLSDRTEVDVAQRIEVGDGQAELVGDEKIEVGQLRTAAGEEDALGRRAVERGAVVGDGAVDIDVQPRHRRADELGDARGIGVVRVGIDAAERDEALALFQAFPPR